VRFETTNRKNSDVRGRKAGGTAMQKELPTYSISTL